LNRIGTIRLTGDIRPRLMEQPSPIETAHQSFVMNRLLWDSQFGRVPEMLYVVFKVSNFMYSQPVNSV
ncbi:Hypothetical predicted protein, partial [Pelobates cultripes]